MNYHRRAFGQKWKFRIGTFPISASRATTEERWVRVQRSRKKRKRTFRYTLSIFHYTYTKKISTTFYTPQKQKFKVGKARPKPENHTDTSFKSKAIILGQLSLHTSAPSASSQFTHHLSLLTSRSDSQRKDSLAYLTTAISARPVHTPLPQPVSIILPRLLPLILDGSNGVRNNLLRLLRALPPRDVEGHMERMLPHIRAGMTHLAQDIGSSALDILQWALEAGGEELVACPGGWMKTVKSLLVMMSWRSSSTAAAAAATEASHHSSGSHNLYAGWSSNSNKSAVFGQAASKEGKILVKCVDTLSALLLAGLGADDNSKEEEREAWGFPLSHTAQHMLPKRSNPFGYLNLFGSPRDEESAGYVYREDRQRVFSRRFQFVILEGLAGLKKEAGEYGRAAAKAEKIVTDCMRGV